MSGKIFSYDEARALIPQVREVTRDANERMRALTADASQAPPGSTRARKLKEWIDTVVRHWAERIEALGALPKGVWTVDFDSGEGFFYCWSFDEEDLSYFHLYEEGFPGRKPLTESAGNGQPPMLLN